MQPLSPSARDDNGTKRRRVVDDERGGFGFGGFDDAHDGASSAKRIALGVGEAFQRHHNHQSRMMNGGTLDGTGTGTGTGGREYVVYGIGNTMVVKRAGAGATASAASAVGCWNVIPSQHGCRVVLFSGSLGECAAFALRNDEANSGY